MAKLEFIRTLNGVVIEKKGSIELVLNIGQPGASAYQSYLATTTDDPKLSEKDWSAARGLQLQSDLAQTDDTKKDFVKNKKTSILENDSNFVSDADYATDKLRLANTSGTNTGDQDLSGLQPKTDALLQTKSTDIVTAINEVNSIAKQASNGRVFATVVDLDAWLAIPENVALLQIGDAFYIVELDVPDYWWDGTQKQELETQKVDLSVYYTSAQIDTLLGNYYTSSEMDTILSGYYTSSQVDTLLSAKEPANSNIQTHIGTTGNPHGTTASEVGAEPTITPTADTTPVDTDYVISKRGATWLKTLYSDLKISLALTFGRLATTNTWALLQTFTSGLKTTKIIPNSDTTGVVIRNAADTSDFAYFDFTNNLLNIGGIKLLRSNASIDALNNIFMYGSIFGQNGTKYVAGDVAFSRIAAGIYEVNNGTAGTLRDLKLRSLFADKIIPNSDTTGVVIRNAGDTEDIVIIKPSTLTALFEVFKPGVGRTSGSLVVGEKNVRIGQISSTGGDSTTTTFVDRNGSIYFSVNPTSGWSYFPENAGFGSSLAPESRIDNRGTTTLRDWVYLNNGTHTGDAVGDRRYKVTSGILIYERCTVLHATRGSGTWVTDLQINSEGVLMPKQAASAPTYVKGGMYFDTTLNKMRIGGATDWETLTSI